MNKITPRNLEVTYKKTKRGYIARCTLKTSAWIHIEADKVGTEGAENEAVRILMMQIYGDVVTKMAQIRGLLNYKFPVEGAPTFDRQIADKIRAVLDSI